MPVGGSGTWGAWETRANNTTYTRNPIGVTLVGVSLFGVSPMEFPMGTQEVHSREILDTLRTKFSEIRITTSYGLKKNI
ncbi:hypothetical protein ACFLWR_00580 [Chloroflexota bacterium]